VRIYLEASCVAVAVVFFLVSLGLDFTARQWLLVLLGLPFGAALYTLPDLVLIGRHYRPIGAVLERLERREKVSALDISRATVHALNLPQNSFLRVTLLHGPAAGAAAALVLAANNWLFDAGFQPWQFVAFVAIIFAFASPTHAMFEFFAVSRYMAPILELLSAQGGILADHRSQLRSSRMRNKLRFLVIFLTIVPLAFFAASLLFKMNHLLHQLGVDATQDQMMSLSLWVGGVVVICIAGSLTMAVLTAAEVSRSAAKLLAAMNEVERGNLDVNLRVTTTDEYADLFRGFNLMIEELRDEVQILEMSQAVMGELQLDQLLEKIIRATTELLDAERGTLLMYDPNTNELWSRVAEGIDLSADGTLGPKHAHSGLREIRFPATAGIAGAVFTSGKLENIPDPYADPRFNPEVDRRTGYRTHSILTTPIQTKHGERIGVTQVLNKRGGQFTRKDEKRLAAFTAQMAIALENARLFDDVLRMKNFNESILRSTSNGMITLDDGRRVTTANEASVSILQTTREALVGHTAKELFGGANEWVLTSLAKVSSTGVTDAAVDADLRLPNGNVASVNLAVVPLIDPSNQSIGTMLILDDITREKRMKSTMSRYMSKEVADQVLEAGETLLGGKDQRVSILFSDIRNFTHVSEELGARETVAMLNEYFSDMVDVVFRYGGILDKYIGDSIMAVFGSPLSRPDDADHAVAVANQMLVTLQALNQRRISSGRPRIDIGVGIATGQVIAGSIGSPKRMEYTAIGDSVNLASRLEGATKVYGVKILISESTVRDLQKPVRLREIDLMRVKGKDQPVAVYEALDHYTEEAFPRMEEMLEVYRRGLELYRVQDWRGAMRFFEAALALRQGDRPSQIYLERCSHFIAKPPPEDWKGVWVLAEK
jgi:adenylate cyclase